MTNLIKHYVKAIGESNGRFYTFHLRHILISTTCFTTYSTSDFIVSNGAMTGETQIGNNPGLCAYDLIKAIFYGSTETNLENPQSGQPPSLPKFIKI